jgi:hypothetical protein
MRPLALTTVLAATDLRPESDVALETAQGLARAAGAVLHVVHAEAATSSAERAVSPRETATTRVRGAARSVAPESGSATRRFTSCPVPPPTRSARSRS